MEQHTDGALHYWLYTPQITQDVMPLIVYLHGGSGKGSDLGLLLTAEGFPQWLYEGKLGNVPAYVLIPQLPPDQKDWASVGDAVAALVEEVAASYPIDKEAISLTGHRMGGTGVFALALAYPDLFARIAPCSGSVRFTEETLSILQNMEIWAFVGTDDTIVPPQPCLHLARALAQTGHMQLTQLEGASHFDVPSLVYLDRGAELIQWLTGSPAL